MKRDKIEFKKGQTVTFKPYEIEYKMIVHTVDIRVSFDINDKRIFYGLASGDENHANVTSKTSGLCIMESIYFKDNENKCK